MQQQTTSIKLNNENTIIGGAGPPLFWKGAGGEVAKNSPKNKKLPP